MRNTPARAGVVWSRLGNGGQWVFASIGVRGAGASVSIASRRDWMLSRYHVTSAGSYWRASCRATVCWKSEAILRMYGRV